MALDSTTVRAEVNGDGTAGPYQCGFRVLNNSDLQVYVGGTLKSLTTHYTVANAGSTSNAEVTFTAGNFPASGTKNVVLVRNVPYTQPSNYQNNTALDAETLEASFDRATMQAQQSTEKIDRAIKFSESATEITTSVTEINAPAATRANKLLAFDSDGNIQVGQEIGTYKGSDATTTTADYVVRDLVKSTTAGQLNNVYICIKDSPSGTALTNSTYWTLIVDAYSASSASTTATTKALEASRSEDNAEAYANTAENSAVTVFGASNAADPTQSGTTTDGYSSLHHREKSKEFAQTVNAQVTDDSGTANQGYSAKEHAIGDLTASGGSAKAWAIDASSPDGTSEKSAKTLAGEASTSATTATTKATEASASATAAAASAAAVANALDSFDDKYLGVMADNASATSATLTGASCAKDASSITFTGSSGTITVGQELTSTGTGYPSSANIIGTSTTSPITISAPFTTAISSVSLSFVGTGVYGAWDASKDGPSTDNDGNALVNGALYFNSTDGEMRVYDTSSNKWIAASAAQNATVLDYTYTLGGSDATISGSDDNSATLSFSAQESVDVFLNGVKLVPKIGGTANDYHLDTANTVTLTSTAVSGDVILVRVYKTFTVGDAVPASTGGTFSGNVSFGDNNITNVGDIAVDTISSDAGTSIGVTLGTNSGDDFNVGSGKLLVEGDNSDVSTTGTFKGNLTAGSGKTIDVSAGTLTLADNQISGNKVDGGDISGLNRVQSQIWTPSSGNTLYMGGNASSSPMSNAPTFSASGFSTNSSMYVVFDPYIDTQSHRVHCYFTWANNSGSTKTFQIHFGRPHNACNFAFTMKNVGEYPSQSFRHYEALVATTSGDGTIFDSMSRELTEYQGNYGVWSSTGGTGDIIWGEPTNYVGNSTTWGTHFTFELGDPANDSYTVDTITFKMV